MREIFENVSASPRLRRFTTSYLGLFFIMTLSVNLIDKYVPILNTMGLNFVKDFIIYLIEGALFYGLVRGIVSKNYRFGEGIASFGETKNYVYYLAYALVKTLYNVVSYFVDSLSDMNGTLGIVGTVLSVLLLLVGFVVNFVLVRLYYDKLMFGREKLELSSVWNGIVDVIKRSPTRIVWAELMLVIVKYIAVAIGVYLVSIISPGVGGHWTVNFIASCLVTIQFGALVYVWPVYYLYYKETCEM